MKTETERKVPEIQEQINRTIACQTANETKLDNLRAERAHYLCEPDVNNDVKIDSLDKSIAALRDEIENAPAVKKELERILTKRQAMDAERERNGKIREQIEAAEDISVYSKNFVALLEKALEVNSQLQQALVKYHALQKQTGQVILSENHCHGSADYLRVLLETMQMQIQGVHTAPVGAGIIGSGVEVRI